MKNTFFFFINHFLCSTQIKKTMKQIFAFIAFAILTFQSFAQENALKLDDNEFLVGKTVVAKVKEVKLGFLQGREARLFNAKDEVLLHLPTRTKTISVTPPNYINYLEIFIPSINDSIQIRNESLQAEGLKFSSSPDEDNIAEYLHMKNIVNPDGTLNMESIKALKELYPMTVLQAHEKATAEAAKCNNSIKTPTNRNTTVSAVITETSREVTGDKVVIKYKIEHEGVLLGEIIGKGPAVNLTNERAEVDFKTKLIYKNSDVAKFPLAYDITNALGCKVANYVATSKRLYTVRADKGGYHGIMEPILTGKAETVKTRIEVVTAMIDYLIKLGYY